jgi:transposase InsO family protein
MPSIRTSILAVVRRRWSYLAPLRDRVEPIQVVADLCHRSRRELVVENATLRHQLSVLRRTGGRPRLGLTDRLRLLVSAACDFIQAYNVFFRQVYAFFIVYLGSRKVVYAAACRNPTQAWTAQQLRNATMDGDAPRILLRDRDDKFGASFDRVAEGVGTRVSKTAVCAPDVNAVAERFVGSARREMLDHVILQDDGRLGRLVGKYKHYFNEARPHQGIGQRIPGKPAAAADITKPTVASPELGGLRLDYRRAA